jgi:hypothetical protein
MENSTGLSSVVQLVHLASAQSTKQIQMDWSKNQTEPPTESATSWGLGPFNSAVMHTGVLRVLVQMGTSVGSAQRSMVTAL